MGEIIYKRKTLAGVAGDAVEVNFDSTATNLEGNNVQDAIQELDAEATSLNSSLTNIDVYVGEDEKLHFVDSAGADTVLNFSSNPNYTKFFNKAETGLQHNPYTTHTDLEVGEYMMYATWGYGNSSSVVSPSLEADLLITGVDNVEKIYQDFNPAIATKYVAPNNGGVFRITSLTQQVMAVKVDKTNLMGSVAYTIFKID